MKKILLALIIVVVFSVSGCKKNNNDDKKTNGVTINGYTIEMDAEVIDKDKDGGYLKKDFTLVDKNKYTKTYSLLLTEVYVSSDNGGDEGIIYDASNIDESDNYDFMPPTGELNIDNKKFDYYIIPDGFIYAYVYYYGDGFSLEFEVYGVSIYNENGDQIKTMPDVDEDVLNSKEFEEILKFDVKKN